MDDDGICDALGGECLPGGPREIAVAFHGVDPAREAGEDRRLVARPRADLEHLVPRANLERLGHETDDRGLRDGLAGGNRERHVLVGAVTEEVADEGFAGCVFEGREHGLVPNSGGAEREDKLHLAGCGVHGAKSSLFADARETYSKVLARVGITSCAVRSARHGVTAIAFSRFAVASAPSDEGMCCGPPWIQKYRRRFGAS